MNFLAKTQQKSCLRFLAHVFTASFGLTRVLLIGDRSWLLCIPLTVGLAFCGYVLAVENNIVVLETLWELP